MPTVEQVYRALPAGTSLLSGEAGIYGEVSWVVRLRPTPPGFDHLRGKEFALVDTATASGLGIALPFLINSLAEQGASALGILGRMNDAGHDYKIPVMELPAGSDLGLLEAQITQLIRDERDRLYQREQELTQALMELTLAGKGVEAVVAKLKEMTGRIILLLDVDFTVLAGEPGKAPPDIRQTLQKLFPAPPAAVTGLKAAPGISGFISAVKGKLGAEGFLLVLAPSAEIEEADRVTAKVGALSLALEISRQQAVEDVEDKFQAEMVDSLLSGDVPAAAAAERAERLGLDLKQSYTVMAVQAAGAGRQGPVNARKAASILNKGLCHARGNLLIVIYPVTPQMTAVDLRKLGQDTSRRLAGLGGTITLGIGRGYSGAAGLRTSMQEAERSLMVGRRLFGEGSASFFGDLGVYRLLLTIGPEELKSFHQDALGALAEYDRQHEGELLRTLEAILCYPTLAETAKELHVHRNTLLYRIQRIQEITNLNLDDGETRLTLHLALRAGEVIRTQ